MKSSDIGYISCVSVCSKTINWSRLEKECEARQYILFKSCWIECLFEYLCLEYKKLHFNITNSTTNRFRPWYVSILYWKFCFSNQLRLINASALEILCFRISKPITVLHILSIISLYSKYAFIEWCNNTWGMLQLPNYKKMQIAIAKLDFPNIHRFLNTIHPAEIIKTIICLLRFCENMQMLIFANDSDVCLHKKQSNVRESEDTDE